MKGSAFQVCKMHWLPSVWTELQIGEEAASAAAQTPFQLLVHIDGGQAITL